MSSKASPSKQADSARDLGTLSREVVILGGVRTPFVKSGSQFDRVSAVDLGTRATLEAMYRTGVPFDDVDEVIFGNVAQPADAANIARVIALRSGFPIATPAHTVHRNCASGMEAITQAFDRVSSGRADVVLCGGVESMSAIPIIYPRSFGKKLLSVVKAKSLFQRLGAFLKFRFKDFKPIFGLEVGLTDPVCGINMGQTAENLAKEFGISRLEQDEFALRSHERTELSEKDGFFKDEIIPVHVGKEQNPIDGDIGPRKGQSLAALAKLRPFFDRKFGSVTVGNACPVTDGAVALVITTREKAEELGVEPMGRIVNYAYAGCPPQRMGLGPVFASSKLLQAEDVSLNEIDRIELNEAFAAQVIACERAFASKEFGQKELGLDDAMGQIDPEKLNANGGAIAMGHPVGASGARIVLTLLRELEQKNLNRGLATLCIGGGQGGAVLIERSGS